jgi:hypothetical protein
MVEYHGDWMIKDEKDTQGGTHIVCGWGLRWYCESLEKAREVADLLNKVTSLAVDVSSE